MRPITILTSLLLFAFSPAWAQSPKKALEKAVETYNAAQTYQDGLIVSTLTDEQVGTVKSRMDLGIALLDQVIREGNSDQIKVARYFKTNFLYTYFYALGMKGRNAEAYELNKQFEADIARYSVSDFPMSYEYFDKTFTIKWENFSLTQAEYYTGVGEICYNLSKYTDAIRFSKLALAHPAVSPYLKYISVNKILDAGLKNSSLLEKNERLDFEVKAVQLYDSQDEETKKIIKDNNYPTARGGSISLVAASKEDNSMAMQVRCATVAPLAAKYENAKEEAFQLYRYCYSHKYDGYEDFHAGALQLAKTFYANGNAEKKAAAQTVGDGALTALAAKVSSTDCEKLKQYADDYQDIGLPSKRQTLEKRVASCLKSREEAARKEEADRRKAEEDRRKQIRRDNRNFNVYVGLDVVPLLTSVSKMDFGGHLDLRGRRVAHSFGFSLVNQRKDYNSNRTKWDGVRYFYTFKIFSNNDNTPTYSGLFFGYSDKNFQELVAVSTTSEDGTNYQFYDQLSPVDKQYELMWNNGMQVLGRPFGLDFWFGIGASYNQLSYKELDSAEGYIFSANEFFEDRKKLESFNLKMRMGLSIGLNLGNKR
jgi:hypothetical protein